MDCMNLGGFYGKITTNVVVVPLAVVIVCLLIFEVQRRSLAAVVAAGGADQSAFVTLKVKLKHNLFLGIFLVYPVRLHKTPLSKGRIGVLPAANSSRLAVTCSGVFVCARSLSRQHSFVSFSAKGLARHHSMRMITT
eukprot:COSAG02_NODE_2520_length_8610_cov_4.542474_4_plen_137_part_00